MDSSDDEGFDFEKFADNEDKSPKRGKAKRAGVAGDNTMAVKLDSFEDILGQRRKEQAENKTSYTSSHEIRK